MPSFKKGANGKIYGQVRRKGRSFSFTAADMDEAKATANLLELQILTGDKLLDKMTDRRLMPELIGRYFDENVDKCVTSKQEGQFDWWIDQLAHVRIQDLGPATIIEKRALLLSTGRSTSTANRYVAALSSALTVACTEWEWLDRNPCKDIRRLKEPKGRTRVLSETDRKRLLYQSGIMAPNRGLALAIRMALATGARKGDLTNLAWANVYPDAVVFEDRKNGQTRRAAVPSFLAIGLKQWRFQLGDPPADYDVFPFGIADRKFKVACKKADVHDFRFHDLRHTFASDLAAAGCTLLEIATALGTTLDMVQRYAHLTDEHTAKVVIDALKDKAF